MRWIKKATSSLLGRQVAKRMLSVNCLLKCPQKLRSVVQNSSQKTIDDIRMEQAKQESTLVDISETDCILQDIKSSIATENIVAFVKGTPENPLCGFSKRAIDILDAIQVEYVSFNVMAHPSIISGSKRESKWQTFPQIFIKGEFIGGTDILVEIAKNGDLFKVLEKHGISHNRVTFT